MRSFWFALLLSGCFNPPDGVFDTAHCADASDVEASFAAVATHYETYCTTCHGTDRTGADRRGAPEDVNYDVFDGSSARPFLTWTRSTDGTMPPMGRMPSQAELLELRGFLECVAAANDLVGDDDSAD